MQKNIKNVYNLYRQKFAEVKYEMKKIVKL